MVLNSGAAGVTDAVFIAGLVEKELDKRCLPRNSGRRSMRTTDSSSTNDRYIVDARMCQVYVVEYVQ